MDGFGLISIIRVVVACSVACLRHYDLTPSHLPARDTQYNPEPPHTKERIFLQQTNDERTTRRTNISWLLFPIFDSTPPIPSHFFFFLSFLSLLASPLSLRPSVHSLSSPCFASCPLLSIYHSSSLPTHIRPPMVFAHTQLFILHYISCVHTFSLWTVSL
ncbi:hypothetical protein C8J57DRAFT_1354838 [Mycena rebaudengoi]|nr:hypothetical protein C8J57DRAFT_1354838 [Mycena rebaudengoi]